MKKLLLFFFALVLSSTFADGDYDSNYYIVDEYEPIVNIYYRGIYEKDVVFTDSKGKEFKKNITNNIAVFDPQTQMTKYIFPQSFNETITGFIYEVAYDTLCNQICFNQSVCSYTALYRNQVCDQHPSIVRNNKNIQRRNASRKLIIITYSFLTKEETVWLCDKSGFNLRKVFESPASFHIDVKNRFLRTAYQDENKLKIKSEPY